MTYELIETIAEKMAVQGVTETLANLELGKEKTADYKKLIDYGLDAKVADKLDEIYKVLIILYNIDIIKHHTS